MTDRRRSTNVLRKTAQKSQQKPAELPRPCDAIQSTIWFGVLVSANMTGIRRGTAACYVQVQVLRMTDIKMGYWLAHSTCCSC